MKAIKFDNMRRTKLALHFIYIKYIQYIISKYINAIIFNINNINIETY